LDENGDKRIVKDNGKAMDFSMKVNTCAFQLDPHFFIVGYKTIRLKEKTMVTKGTGTKHDLVRHDAVRTGMDEIPIAQFFGGS
jgi:hypothetical protein